MRGFALLTTFTCYFFGCNAVSSAISRACSIYCEGIILQTIQMAQVFNDSKTFVDMPMKFDPEQVTENFSKLPSYNTSTLVSFLNNNFYPAGSDITNYVPPDFSDNPKFLQYITNPSIRQWAYDVNQLWLVLSRNVSMSVVENPQRHSFTPYRYSMVIPGGRFRESYYWDSYWIVKGLLVCDMNVTAWKEIGNLLQDVANFGFVPNGGRIYYLDRSQPPLLTEMVSEFLDYVGWNTALGIETLQYALPLLEQEYHWWMDASNGHVVQVNGYILNRFHSNGTTPRPEGYYDDVVTCQEGNVTKPEPWAPLCYNNVRSGAETGWDFSSRWLKAPYHNMSSIDTGSIVPVDLNSILYAVEMNLATMVSFLQSNGLPFVFNYSQYNASFFLDAAQQRYTAMNAVLWENAASKWMDWNISANAFSSAEIVTIASWTPMWAGLLADANFHSASIELSAAEKLQMFQDAVFADSMSNPTYSHASRRRDPQWRDRLFSSKTPNVVAASSSMTNYSPTAVLASLQASGLIQAGGILTTVLETGQQWDAPNAWPPLVWLAIEGLNNLGLQDATNLATQITNNWLNTNYLAYEAKGFMYEKYNSFEVGVGGGGGEYVPQVGFGWTNGVALSLLAVVYPPVTPTSSGTSSGLKPWQIGVISAGVILAVAFCALLVYRYAFYKKPKQSGLLEEGGKNDML